jgi:CubicO group peptidase (beta-lactamase class C family)
MLTTIVAGRGAGAVQGPALPADAAVDKIFARWTTETPGCAVGVSKDGAPVLQKAYGMADLEHDVRNTPHTIFEAGSVSKQFTAAAIALLARDGKLSLDDQVRKHVPELPDYGVPLTIRHTLMHMSGLRDWGSVAAIGGWPRTSRVYTHAHVLDIISRQKALNFTPGARYSYSNSGYNLAAIIVSRVSGKSFAEFSEERLFKPLGMTRTSWRDDFTRIVKDRAIAYSDERGSFAQDMPFENVHGNGGLLTTVGDMLRWNEHFVKPVIGDMDFVRLQQAPGNFNDGKPGTYALGLMIGKYKGVNEVGHSGSTAGYRAHLARYPDQRVSIAVLCNVTSGAATQYAHAVADLYLGPALQGTATTPAGRRPQPAQTFKPTRAQLAAYAGTYTSDEAETVFTIEVDGDDLVLKRRPATRIVLRPTVDDTFSSGAGIGTIKFHRTAGQVTQLGVMQDRVFDLRFHKNH